MISSSSAGWPRSRTAAPPAGPPLGDDPLPFVGNRNLYVVTDEGVIDFLGEIVAVGSYEAVAASAMAIDLGGFQCRVLGLEALIACKRALGRPKDLRVALEREQVRRRLRSP